MCSAELGTLTLTNAMHDHVRLACGVLHDPHWQQAWLCFNVALRCRYKKHAGGDALACFPMQLASDIGSDIGSDGWPGVMALKLKGADGVRSVYEMFRRVPGLNEQTAPELYAYLKET